MADMASGVHAACAFGGLLLGHPILSAELALLVALLAGAGRAAGAPMVFWDEDVKRQLIAGASVALCECEILFAAYRHDHLHRPEPSGELAIPLSAGPQIYREALGQGGSPATEALSTTVFEFAGEASLSWHLTTAEVAGIKAQADSKGISEKKDAIDAWLRTA